MSVKLAIGLLKVQQFKQTSLTAMTYSVDVSCAGRRRSKHAKDESTPTVIGANCQAAINCLWVFKLDKFRRPCLYC